MPIRWTYCNATADPYIVADQLNDAVTGLSYGIILQPDLVWYFDAPEGSSTTVPTKRLVDYQGRKVEAEIVEFNQDTPETWNQYTLKDGTVVRMKTVLFEVLRLVNEFGPNGDPVYTFTAQQIVSSHSPDNLKKRV